MAILYGDGIHDDYPYIQELLDSGICEVSLPAPKVCFLISKALKIHSNQALKLPRFATIRLADNANCDMIENADWDNWNENVLIEGGIWDMNHKNQYPNPFHFPDKFGKKIRDYSIECGYDPKTSKTFRKNIYTGKCMRFCRVKNFTIKNITILNPVNFGIQVAYIEDFTFKDIW